MLVTVKPPLAIKERRVVTFDPRLETKGASKEGFLQKKKLFVFGWSSG